jgi:hypothetical protein
MTTAVRPNVHDRTGGIVRHLEELSRQLESLDTVPDLARALADMRQVKNLLAFILSETEQRLAKAMTEPAVEVEGVGLVERHRKTSRKAWDNESLLRDLTPHLVATEDGEPLDGPSVLERVQEVFRLSGSNARVTVLRDLLGVRTLDEYCQETHEGWTVQLPAVTP